MSAGFKTELVATLVDVDEDSWMIHEPLVYEARDGRVFTVSAGFISRQFASIPRLPVIYWIFERPDTHRPGVLHDWLLGVFDRKHCDDLLYEALRSEGVGRVRARLMWAAVRGYSVFLANRR